MTFYGVLHKPTNTLFPLMKTGSTYFDFYEQPKRSRHRVALAPRLFESPRMAKRYISEYCKGIRTNENFIYGDAVSYRFPNNPRNPEDFKIVIINLTIAGTINV